MLFLTSLWFIGEEKALLSICVRGSWVLCQVKANREKNLEGLDFEVAVKSCWEFKELPEIIPRDFEATSRPSCKVSGKVTKIHFFHISGILALLGGSESTQNSEFPPKYLTLVFYSTIEAF